MQEQEDEPRGVAVDPLPDGLPDNELFELAMKDVKSLGWSAVPLHNRPPVEIQPQDEEQDALRALEERLPPSIFLRVHRNAIVNVAHVRKMSALSSNRWLLTLTGDQQFVVSKRQAHNVRVLLQH